MKKHNIIFILSKAILPFHFSHPTQKSVVGRASLPSFSSAYSAGRPVLRLLSLLTYLAYLTRSPFISLVHSVAIFLSLVIIKISCNFPVYPTLDTNSAIAGFRLWNFLLISVVLVLFVITFSFLPLIMS